MPGDERPPQGEPFAAIPHSIGADGRITDADYRVLGALTFWACGKMECWPSVAEIGKRIGKGRTAIQASLRRLESIGYVRSEDDARNPTGRRLVLLWRTSTAKVQPPIETLKAGEKGARNSMPSRSDIRTPPPGIQGTPALKSEHPPARNSVPEGEVLVRELQEKDVKNLRGEFPGDGRPSGPAPGHTPASDEAIAAIETLEAEAEAYGVSVEIALRGVYARVPRKISYESWAAGANAWRRKNSEESLDFRRKFARWRLDHSLTARPKPESPPEPDLGPDGLPATASNTNEISHLPLNGNGNDSTATPSIEVAHAVKMIVAGPTPEKSADAGEATDWEPFLATLDAAKAKGIRGMIGMGGQHAETALKSLRRLRGDPEPVAPAPRLESPATVRPPPPQSRRFERQAAGMPVPRGPQTLSEVVDRMDLTAAAREFGHLAEVPSAMAYAKAGRLLGAIEPGNTDRVAAKAAAEALAADFADPHSLHYYIGVCGRVQRGELRKETVLDAHRTACTTPAADLPRTKKSPRGTVFVNLIKARTPSRKATG